MSVDTYVEHYRTSDQYAGTDQEHRRGGTFGLEILDVRQPSGEFTDPAVAEYAFVTNMNTPGPGEFNFGDGWFSDSNQKGCVHLQPIHTEAEFRIPAMHLRGVIVPEKSLDERLLELSLTPATFSNISGRFTRLPLAARMVEAMWDASRTSGPSASLALDGAFLSFLAELLRACGDDRLLEPPPAVGDARLRRVIDYVEAHIETSLNVGELAGIACVSVFHFGRIFRAATGETPHRYVMRRRVERAKEMLLTTELDLTSIALTCGFASHSHLTECFHRHVGAAPGAWRREVRT